MSTPGLLFDAPSLYVDLPISPRPLRDRPAEIHCGYASTFPGQEVGDQINRALCGPS
jgi:hypothetical protein